MTTSIRPATVEDRERWDGFVLNNTNGLSYHLFAWKQAVEDAYGFDCPYFLAERSGEVKGILPTVHLHLPFCRGSLVSLPYCDFGGALADPPEIAESLVFHACTYALERKIPYLDLRLSVEPPAVSNDLSGFSKVRMLLELPESVETLLASFKSKLRSQVNKPQRDGLNVKLGGLEILEDFYSVFAENMRDLGSPVHSRKWISCVLSYFGERAKCGVAYMPDGMPAACGIILCHDTTVSIPWASSLRRFNRHNPNMLLYWTFLKYAVSHGYPFFDFGRSTPGEGTYRFKAQWGAAPRPLHWKRLKPGSNGISQMNVEARATGRSRAVAEKLIRKMPVSAAAFFNSRIRKYISL